MDRVSGDCSDLSQRGIGQYVVLTYCFKCKHEIQRRHSSVKPTCTNVANMKYTEFHSQRNFILSSHLLNWSIMSKILCPIIIKIARKSFCVIKSEILVRMRGNTPNCTKMYFPCPTHTGSKFFKTIHTIKVLEGGIINVYTHGSTPKIGIAFQCLKNACF